MNRFELSLAVAALVPAGMAMAAGTPEVHLEVSGTSLVPLTAGEWNGSAPGGPFNFTAIYDEYTRVVSDAEPVSLDFVGRDTIQPRLWTNDADLFEIEVLYPNTFGVYTVNEFTGFTGGHTLALFDSSGKALKAGINLTVNNPLTVDAPGTYYLGLGADGSIPRNDAGEDLFDLSTTGVVVLPEALADQTLASDPQTAWSVFNTPNLPTSFLIGPGNFTRPSSTIYNLVPSPVSAAGGLVLLGAVAARRRRA